MSLSTQPYKGARDFYPEDKRTQKYILEVLRRVVESFGYQEYDAPLLEPFELYAAKSGEEIVNEQLYWFEDRGGRRMAIRPEMTPSVSRMVAAKRQELAYPLRLYSIPNLWRYERPQRGRLREHYQLNVDIFGVEGSEADAEIIQVADEILKSLGARQDMYRININSRQAMVEAMNSFGLSETELKAAYKLVDKMPKLDDASFDKLLSDQIGETKAASLRNYLRNDQPPERVRRILEMLKTSGVDSAVYEPSVVRGIEYYSDIVFEVFDTNPENARALFGGGRYDGLVELFGVEHLPVVGFGMGDVSLQNFLETHSLLPRLTAAADVSVILIGDVYGRVQPILKRLRAEGINTAVDFSQRKLDPQIKSAVKSGVGFALFIGEKELESHQLKLRDLAKGEERDLTIDEIVDELVSSRKTD
ncbi:MAG TPA: histidine--tRNA ligase [Candidatus Saccharimonadales bacterium]|nr:histidine--tRNA ligase [Candidatus Saccharimonadales bacterium]